MQFILIIFEIINKRKVAFSSLILASFGFVVARYFGASEETALSIMNTFLSLDINIDLKVVFTILSIIIFIVILVWFFINKEKRKINKMKLRLEEERIETEILKHDLEQKQLKEKLNEKLND